MSCFELTRGSMISNTKLIEIESHRALEHNRVGQKGAKSCTPLQNCPTSASERMMYFPILKQFRFSAKNNWIPTLQIWISRSYLHSITITRRTMPADTAGKVSRSTQNPASLRHQLICSISPSHARYIPTHSRARDKHPADAIQAAVAWEAGKDLTIEDIEVEAPKAHEVRIEIYYTGVCHTGAFQKIIDQSARWTEALQMHTHSQAKTPKAPSPSS